MRLSRTAYQIIVLFFILAALAGIAFMFYSMRTDMFTLLIVLSVAVVLFAICPIDTLVHELGHLFFGLCGGMRVYSFSVRFWKISAIGISFAKNSGADGATAFYLKDEKHARGKIIALSLGGIVFNFIYGAVFLSLYFFLPHSIPFMIFALYAPLSIVTGLSNLLPVDLPIGRTDGGLCLGLLKHSPTAEVTLSVFIAQGILYRKSFSDIPRKVLFDTPVIREDDFVFALLTLLRYQYYLFSDEREKAAKEAERLDGIWDDILPQIQGEIACELAYYYLAVSPEKEKAERYFALADKKAGSTYKLAYAAYAKTNGKEAEEGKLQKEIAKQPLYGIRELQIKQYTAI